MSLLNDLIKEVEAHTNREFNLDNRRDRFHLNAKIERLHSDELRRLRLIGKALHSDEGENELYNDKVEYTRKRYNE